MNELSGAWVHEFMLFDARTVLFRIDLTKHPELIDADVVQRCMEEYTDHYPNVERWSASRNMAYGLWDILDIVVIGNINLDAVKNYTQE
jgi:hypothetical protein